MTCRSDSQIDWLCLSRILGLCLALVLVAPSLADNVEAGQASHASIGEAGTQEGPSLAFTIMNSRRGRELFASKGCVICHSVNGVGGQDAANLDAHTMQPYMNPFEFAARMWRGAATMIVLQEEALGYQIELTGQELADIIAFVHDHDEQHSFSEADIPPQIEKLIDHEHKHTGGGAAAHKRELGHTQPEDAHETD